MMDIYPLGDAFGIKDDFILKRRRKMVRPAGLEPATSSFGN